MLIFSKIFHIRFLCLIATSSKVFHTTKKNTNKNEKKIYSLPGYSWHKSWRMWQHNDVSNYSHYYRNENIYCTFTWDTSIVITLHSAVPPSKLLMVSPLDMERLSPVTQEDAMPLVLVDLSDLTEVVSAFSFLQKRTHKNTIDLLHMDMHPWFQIIIKRQNDNIKKRGGG